METNEWDEIVGKIGMATYGGVLFKPTREYRNEIKVILEQHFIPISELKRWVEENEKELGFVLTRPQIEDYGYNSALKALKDRFIKE